MRLTNLLFVLASLGPCLGVQAEGVEDPAMNPEAVLKKDYADKRYWPSGQGLRERIEFCGGDWCQEVLMERPETSQKQAWDAAFLMFYFFDANEGFRSRRSATATRLLDRYSKSCVSGAPESRASCILQKLQSAHKLKYRRVQYDVGYRCYSEFDAAPPHFTNRGACRRIKASPSKNADTR